MTLQDSIVISQDVVFREVGGETVLLNLATGMYYGLSDVGTRAWELLQEKRSLHEMFSVLLAEYDVPAQQLEADLLRLLRDLREHKIVEVVASAAG